MFRKWSLTVLVTVLVFVAAQRNAIAQRNFNNIPALVFEPSTSPWGVLTVDTARTVGNLKIHVGLMFSYVNDPVVAEGPGVPTYRVVNDQIVGDVVFAMGFWDFLELGVHMPAIFYSDDAGDAALVGLQDLDRKAVAIGDVRIVPKARFWKNSRSGIGLALIPQFTVHSGLEKENAGERFMTFEPRVALDYTFKQGTVIALNVGYRMRKNIVVGRLRIDDEFTYGLGMEINLFRRQLSFLAEIFGSVGFNDTKNDPDKSIDLEEMPLEAGGAIRYRAPFGLILTVGGSAGVIRDGWGTPDFRMFVGLGFTTSRIPKGEPPPELDADRDGIEDKDDRCPNDPEDKDGFQDSDGCPDPDNDKDGVCDDNPAIQAALDKYKDVCKGKDLCGMRAEDKDGFEDEDGCPEPDNDKDGVCDDFEQIQKDLPKYAAVCKGADKCPKQAEDRDGFEDEDGCPDPDNDKDKVCDDNEQIQKNLSTFRKICRGADKCPNDPEDKDGFQDKDGCPDPDNDGDGFCDNNPTIQGNLAKYAAVCRGKDKCPNKPETINGYKDDDGCPDKGKPKVKVVGKKIVIMEKIYFKTNKATIMKRSYRLLAMVAATLRSHVRIQQVRIEGHTDERGDDDRNMDLSVRRAQAVRDFLVKWGIKSSRLVARGYGETKPIQAGCKKLRRRLRKKCWAKNRRVEFNIIKQAK